MVRHACALSAIGIFMAASAGAAEPGATDGTTGAAKTAPTTMPSTPGKEGPASPMQGPVSADVEKGKQVCSDLSGQPREACEARATSTAESPRGREGANPTGSGPGKPAAGAQDAAK